MAPELKSLIICLADGAVHSKATLAQKLGLSRDAICALIPQVAVLGLEVVITQAGEQYCIPGGIELFSAVAMLPHLKPAIRELISVEIVDSIDSSNRYLLAQASQSLQPRICLAEHQSAGRGRNQRQWVSPFGRNIYLSMLWHFTCEATALTGLTLAVGVALVRALHTYGVRDVGLKWPNDVYVLKRKLAGTLVEMVVDSQGGCHVVVGVGLNVSMPVATQMAISQPWIDLAAISDIKPQKNVMAALMINELARVLMHFESTGLAAYRAEWASYDVLVNQPVTVHTPQGDISGIANGIDEQGGLWVYSEKKQYSFSSGEVSVRWSE